MSKIRFKNQTTPSTPPADRTSLYIDLTSKQLHQVDDSGLVTNVVTGVSGSGGSITNYGSLSSPPTGGTYLQGDFFYHTGRHDFYFYDGFRSKWLSKTEHQLKFSGPGDTASGDYFKLGGVTMSSGKGELCIYPATVTSISYTRADSDQVVLQVTASGSTAGPGELNSTSTLGRNKTANYDLAENKVMGVRSKSGFNICTDMTGVVTYRWRA